MAKYYLLNRLPVEVTHVGLATWDGKFLVASHDAVELGDGERSMTEDELRHYCRQVRMDFEYMSTRFL